MMLTERDKTFDVVIIASPNVNPGYKLVGNELYPKIAEDYRRMFRVLAGLPCDFFLGAHGAYFGMAEKYPRMKAGAPSPFIDPEGYKKFVADKELEFRTELEKQTAAAPATPGRRGTVHHQAEGWTERARPRLGCRDAAPRPCRIALVDGRIHGRAVPRVARPTAAGLATPSVRGR
jgi:hypothetical protein